MPERRPDARVDLQMHTTYSDGRWQPTDLFAYLAEQRFHVVAVTDHDTMAHLTECQALADQHGLLLVPAVEVTATWRGHSAHILCYAVRFTNDALERLVEQTTRRQRENTLAVHAALLARGCVFPRQHEVLAAHGGALVRPVDNARLLQAHGYAPTLGAAMAQIRAAGYTSITAPLADVVEAAHASGAVALLAHPGRGGGEIHRYDVPQVEALLAEVPLDGLEVHYPLHTAQQVAAYATLARERGLLVGAGSDSHGPHQRLPVPYAACEVAALLERCGITVAA